MKKYFGTDGIRGIANEELTPELAFKVAKATSIVLGEGTTVCIGKDTRISCDMLESALVSGFLSNGVNVKLLGIIPTPGVAFLTRTMNFDAGIVISASHNSFEYNGIKIFSNKGMKISDEVEEQIESLFESESNNKKIGKLEYSFDLRQQYEEMLLEEFRNLSTKLNIAIDTANGATYEVAKNVFDKLDLKFELISNEPNGTNINDNCGSTHLENLRQFVITNHMDLGIAYDGDGDRCLAIDENGEILDGDAFLATIGKYLYEEGKLNKNTIVATVMSNLGLNIFANENSMEITQTKVGDKYVLEEMLKNGFNFGGEQSGHTILLDYNPTGDGILTSLMFIKVLTAKNVKPSEVWTYFKKYPQVLVNVNVDSQKKYDYNNYKEITDAISELEKEFMGEGRVLIRPSGTEPVIRIMIEGKDEEYIRKKAEDIALIFKENLK